MILSLESCLYALSVLFIAQEEEDVKTTQHGTAIAAMFVYVPKQPRGKRKARGNAGKKTNAPKKPSVPSPQPMKDCPPSQDTHKVPTNNQQHLPIHVAPPRPQLQPLPYSYPSGPPPICFHAPVPAQQSSSALIPSNGKPVASTPKLRSKNSSGKALVKAAKSTVDINKTVVKDSFGEVQQHWNNGTAALLGSRAACDVISAKFDEILTSIDGDCFSGREEDLRK